MKLKLPSIPIQILLFVVFILAGSSLFIRFYFLDSVEVLNQKLEKMDHSNDLKKLVAEMSPHLDDSNAVKLKNSVRQIMNREKQKGLAVEFHKRDLTQYSFIVLLFMVVLLGVVIAFFVRMITRPIQELVTATNQISTGDLTARVAEHKLSPLRGLLKSFNKMVTDLEYSRQQLIKAEKEVIWKEMARALAHEIKNPITPVRLTLDRIESVHSANSEKLLSIILPSIAVIREEVSGLEKLALEFSRFARLPEPNPEIIDITEFVTDILAGYEKRISINVENNLVDVHLSADKLQLRQVFNNLIKNAIEAQAEKLFIDLEKQNHEFCIRLKDNGVGIEPSNIEKIFEPYFTLRKKGTGLGLAISRRILLQIGGSLEVKSIKNQHTTFTMKIPERQS